MSTKLLPRRVARSVARFGTTIAAAVALLISAAPSGAQAAPIQPASLDDTWACSVPSGYVYVEVVQSRLCGLLPGSQGPRFHLRLPVDGLVACTPASGWTYDQITYTKACSQLSTSTASTFRIRQPVNGLWACVVPYGWSYSATGTTYNCSYTPGLPSNWFQLAQ